MGKREQQKRQSLAKILDVSSVKLREKGIDGVGIAAVMQEAGLTHGAFYAHFSNKDELAQEAFKHAVRTGRSQWLGKRKESWPARLKRLAASYLTPGMRDDVGHSCALAALASYVPSAKPGFREAYESELIDTLRLICECAENGEPDPQKFNEAVAFFALCLGGLNLARSIGDEKLSRRILQVCRDKAADVG